jgi:hypothetical protein
MKTGWQYYTAKEVKEKLGITQGELNTFIRNGTLRPETPPGKKQGVYNRTHVDQLIRERQAFMALPQKTSSVFRKAAAEDIPATVEITRVLFGLRESPETTLARRQAWFQQNQGLFYVLKSAEQIVGYILLLPLKPEKIEKIVRGEEYAQDTDASEIADFTSAKPLHIYLMGMGVIPGVSYYEKRSYGARLVAGIMKVLVDLGKSGIVIETITARSDTPDGIRLLKRGFTEIPTTTHARNFIINVRESGIPIIVSYKEALKASGSFPPDWK